MTIYHVDKVLHEIVIDDANCDRFVADPEQYLAGRDLNEAERSALVGHDWAKLYALGGHPFLLFHAVFRVGAPDKLMNMPLFKQYMNSIQGMGTPDFST